MFVVILAEIDQAVFLYNAFYRHTDGHFVTKTFLSLGNPETDTSTKLSNSIFWRSQYFFFILVYARK